MLHQNIFYVALIPADLYTFSWGFYTIFKIFSRPINVFAIISILQSCKPLGDLIWYSFLTCSSLTFLRLNLITLKFWVAYLHKDSLSQSLENNSYHSQLPEISYIEYSWTASPIYQYVINVIAIFPISKVPYVNIRMFRCGNIII